jgi:hypothetical protein
LPAQLDILGAVQDTVSLKFQWPDRKPALFPGGFRAYAVIDERVVIKNKVEAIVIFDGASLSAIRGAGMTSQ